MLNEGQSMVEFSLPAHDGSTVSSEDLEGRAYLLYFYPKAATPGWTKEACQLRDSWSELKALGVEVLGVSYDSVGTNRTFAAKNELPFLLLSDSQRTLARAVGANRSLLPVPKRISYLVGSDGTVLKAYPSVSPSTHAAEILADLRALKGEE